MSEIIHSKAIGAKLTQDAINKAGVEDMGELTLAIHSKILLKKIKFPVLEHCAAILFKKLDAEKHIAFTDELVKTKEIGCWVIVGKLLQYRLEEHFKECQYKAVEYIIYGNEWYVCDIIGERVLGHGLLMYPQKTLPLLQENTRHSDKWIVRAVGVAAHYATKKGLQMPYVEDVFKLLLSQANTTDFHTKKGIGWGAKTIAKFHPALMEKYSDAIFSSVEVKQWFKTKVNMGLNRHQYAKRNKS